MLKVFFHGGVIDRQGGVEQRLAVFLGAIEKVGRDFLVVEFRTEFAAFPDDGFHADEIDDADELILDTDGQLQRQRDDIELFLQRGGGAVKVGAGAVQLVDENDTGDVVAVGEAPVGFRLGLHASHTLNDENRAVQHAQRTVHFDVEVDMAGGVDDVDAVVLPLARHRCRGDGDPPLPLLLHVVRGGIAVVHFPDPMGYPGVVQDALGSGGLARVDMRGDPDVTDQGKVVVSGLWSRWGGRH